jgi:hypothetical protein
MASGDSVKNFFCETELTFGTGISSTCKLKEAAFRPDSIKIKTTSCASSDEFGYHLIDNSSDHENSKNFSFGIDLSMSLIPLSLSVGSHLNTTSAIKSNDVMVKAYRKILKSESTLDQFDQLALSDEATKILQDSTKKFHEIYGDYFVFGSVKGDQFFFDCSDNSACKKLISVHRWRLRDQRRHKRRKQRQENRISYITQPERTKSRCKR